VAGITDETGGVTKEGVDGRAVAGRWVLQMQPPASEQCFRHQRLSQSGAIRFFPHPEMGHAAVGAAVGTKAVMLAGGKMTAGSDDGGVPCLN